MKPNTTCTPARSRSRAQRIFASFVEARLEFHERSHGFAHFRCVDERADNRAVIRGAIEGLLDCENIRVARRLQQKLHDDVEALIGVVNHHVLFADGGKAIAGLFAHALREAGIVGLEAQIVARRLGDFRQGVERKQTRRTATRLSGTPQFLHDELAQRGRHFRIRFDADDLAAAAALERGFKEANEIFRFFSTSISLSLIMRKCRRPSPRNPGTAGR